MPKKHDPYLLNRRIESLDREQLETFISIYRKKVLQELSTLRLLTKEIVMRLDASVPAGLGLARRLSSALIRMQAADRRLREAEERWDELNFGDGRKFGDVLPKKARWVFGVDLAKEYEKDKEEAAMDSDTEDEDSEEEEEFDAEEVEKEMEKDNDDKSNE